MAETASGHSDQGLNNRNILKSIVHTSSSFHFFTKVVILICIPSIFIFLFIAHNNRQTFNSLVQAELTSTVSCEKVNIPIFGEKPDNKRAELLVPQLDSATQELNTRYVELKNRQVLGKKNELIKLAKARKSLFVETIVRNPNAAIKAILPENSLSELHNLIDTCVETSAEFEGVLEVIHADSSDYTISDTHFVLHTNDGKAINLHPAGNLYVGLESRTKIRVKGVIIDNELVFDASRSLKQAIDSKGGIDIVSQPGNPPVIGDQKTVFILANFQNTTQPNLTQSQENSFIANELNPYYVENSYKKISLTGDAFGWYTVPIDQTCGYGAIQSQAINAADNDVFFPNYDRLVIVAPYGPSCWWGGMATFGKTAITTADGTVNMSVSWIVADYGANLPLVGHELGHNFGNDHASFADCGDMTITSNYSECTIDEYGDSYDIMGTGNSFHFDAAHKEYVGWFEPSNIQTVTANGAYVLEPIEIASLNLKAIKIQRNANDYIYVEYRQPIGYDSGNALNNIYQGALIHSLISPIKTGLLDPTPLDSRSTIILASGSSFIDPATKSQITVVSATPSFLTLQVSLGKTDFIPPASSIISPTSTSTVSGTITVTADASDASGIEKVEFYQNGILLGTDTTAPYEAQLDTTKILNGNATVVIKAYDLSGAAFGVPGNVGYSSGNFTVFNTDSIPPNLTVTSPTSGSAQTSPVTLAATASDDVGVWKVEFFKDAEPLPYTRFTSPYSFTIPFSNGDHTVYAKAYDFVGNMTQSEPINFAVFTPTPTPTPTPDIIKPTVSITSPLNGATVTKKSTVTISANASDNVGVTKVSFYVNGALQCTDTTANYSCVWLVPQAPNKTYQLQVSAYDAANNIGSSSIVTVKSSR